MALFKYGFKRKYVGFRKSFFHEGLRVQLATKLSWYMVFYFNKALVIMIFEWLVTCYAMAAIYNYKDI